MKKREFTSLGFISGLVILLINDFFLKHYFGNWFTGKLSDFAGLFIFPMFWSILFPRFKNIIYFATLVLFIYWKSEFSQLLIDFFKYHSYFKIDRVVDVTDLLALSILPISYLYGQSSKTTIHIKPVIIICIASFSFMATSYSSKIEHKQTYSFDYSLEKLKTRIYYLKGISNQYEDKQEQENYIIDSSGKYKIHRLNLDTISSTEVPINKFVKDTMDLFVYDDFCFKGYNATIVIKGNSKKSELQLLEFHHSCPKNEKSFTKWNDDEEILSESFEEKIIEQLKKKEQ